MSCFMFSSARCIVTYLNAVGYACGYKSDTHWHYTWSGRDDEKNLFPFPVSSVAQSVAWSLYKMSYPDSDVVYLNTVEYTTQYQEMNANLTSIGSICVQEHMKVRKGRGSEDGRTSGHWMAVSDRFPFPRPLGNYMEQNTSWEAYSCPANLPFKEEEGLFPCWQETALVPTLRQMSPLETPLLCCPSSTPLFDVFFPFRFSDYNFLLVSHFSHACYMRCPSHSLGFVHFTIICRRACSTNY
jgi:hypothetical protein